MIKLFGEEFAIDSDKYQWRVLKRRGKDKDGKDIYTPEMYYTTFQGVVKGLLQNRMKDSEYESVEDLANRVEEIYAEISEKLGHISLGDSITRES